MHRPALLLPLAAALLPACAPIDGTYLFTLATTAPVGDECSSGVTHDFIGAYEPPEAPADTTWTRTTDTDYSPELFFARIEQDGDTAVMIVGSEVLPGGRSDDGGWSFSWTRATDTYDNEVHSAGYAYTYTNESSSTTRITGTFGPDGFVGLWDAETMSTQSWTETDTWSEEAAATIGTAGRIPASSYLLRLDSTGAEVAASNDYLVQDCDVTGCLMTVTEACGYSYDLSGQPTGFTSDDATWTEDAGQSAGL